MNLIDRESLLEKIQFRIEPQGVIGATVRDMVEKTREIILDEPTFFKSLARIKKVNDRRKSYVYGCTACNGTFYFCGTDCNYNFCPRCGRLFEVGEEDGN